VGIDEDYIAPGRFQNSGDVQQREGRENPVILFDRLDSGFIPNRPIGRVDKRYFYTFRGGHGDSVLPV
jgi:hypothetical protein